jgi:hypothetical protein
MGWRPCTFVVDISRVKEGPWENRQHGVDHHGKIMPGKDESKVGLSVIEQLLYVYPIPMYLFPIHHKSYQQHAF